MTENATTTMIAVPLSNADRCDRCGAAAKIRATLAGGGELLFCRHHYNGHEAPLAEAGARISE
ncbi:MAG: hypothetical protein WAW85_02870 [Gordonia sp. (in: high G+C Gram-positive bacteria)]|uniref:DUF7455 domain-containing protein n=1 Tax=Gordonia sp. (in: high G+C Gram-positive bacteria) TaxID=84139 RepID=UPI003BB6C83B